MAEGYTAATGTFPRRLLAALLAAQAAGGDARGQMSAAMLVVGAERMPNPWDGQLLSIRIDRSTDPLADLAALIDAADAYDGFNRAVDTLMAGDPASALENANNALDLLPNEENIRFVRSGALAALGDPTAAGEELRLLITERPTWETIVRSFATKGLMAVPPGESIDSMLEDLLR